MVIVLSGSSASGKNTLINELLKTEKDLKYIQTFTSRLMREGESEGNPYHFITKEEFQNKIKNGDFFEYELIHNNFYGVDKKICLKELEQNFNIIKDMGVYGTFNLKEKLKDITKVETIYLYVDKRTLKKRLINRGEKQIKLRLKRCREENKNINKYDFVIHNYDKTITLNIIKKLLSKKYEKCADYITALKTKVNFKRVKKHIDKLNNNKIYKPIKILFDGENFAVKNDIEKLLASIISNKNITKRICFIKTKISSNNNLNKFIADFN